MRIPNSKRCGLWKLLLLFYTPFWNSCFKYFAANCKLNDKECLTCMPIDEQRCKICSPGLFADYHAKKCKSKLPTQKWKCCQGDRLGIHWRRWSLPSTSSMNTRAVTLTNIRFQCILHTYSISQEICTRFCCALLCCGYVIVRNEFTWSIHPHSPGLLCWHWGNR